MSGFAAELLDGATLTVETALSPPMTFSLAPSDEPPGVLTRTLRPRFTLQRGNVVLLRHEPAGKLEERRTAFLAMGAVALVVLVLILDR